MIKLIREFVTDFEWIHDGIGNFGNLCFVIGSVLFLWKGAEIWGVWLFIVGSAGMLVGSAGATLVRWEHRIRKDGDMGVRQAPAA